MEKTLLELRDVFFSYGDKPLLEGLSFELRYGERVGITGHNGAGKTTMVEIAMGFLKPQRGSILFNGRPLESENDFYELRKSVGYVFQDPDDQLFCPTVFEDVAFGPLNLGLRGKEVEERVNEVLRKLGILHLKDKITYKLSGGEKRLVSIAAVLAMEPEGLILDEPVNGLDEEARARVEHILVSLSKSIVVISHDISFLKRVCGRILRLESGKLVELHL